MNRNIRLLFCLLLAACLQTASAQSSKGLSLATPAMRIAEGKTYALICGISKYKSPSIPSLQFADRDALAFRNYLVATGVDSNNITLLLNEKATNGEFWASLNYLTDLAKSGDKVYIYFSGHGDVENKTVVKDAYILPYDAPKCVYPAGAIAVPLLKSWIANFSANGIQAVFIADACRSGNLAGGREGMEATASMLKDKWQDEIKILSCQPGELSLEGKQWGNGRGLFSYELINGLSGLADKNKDGKVSLRELNLYLMEKVPDEASPMPQNPMIFGNMEYSISTVDNVYLKSISSQNSGLAFASIESKGMEDGLLAGLDPQVKASYSSFKTMMDSQIYVRRENVEYLPSAAYFYLQIPDQPSTHLLKAFMQKNLSSSILNKSAMLLNDFLSKSTQNTTHERFMQCSNEIRFLRTLMGNDKLKKLGFYSQAVFFENAAFETLDEFTGAKQRIDTLLMTDTTASYVYLLRANFNEQTGGDINQAISDLKRAIRLSPSWEFPYSSLARMYTKKHSLDSVLVIGNMVHQRFGNSFDFEIYGLIGNAYAIDKKTDSALYYFSKIIDVDLPYKDSAAIGNSMKMIGNYALQSAAYELALRFYDKAIYLNPTLKSRCHFNQALCYSMLGQKAKGLEYLESSMKEGFSDYSMIDGNRYLDSLRSEHQFNKLIKKYIPDSLIRNATIKAADLEKYSGVYSSPSIPMRFTISHNGNTLYVQPGELRALSLDYVSPGKYIRMDNGMEFSFQPEKNQFILSQKGSESYTFTRDKK